MSRAVRAAGRGARGGARTCARGAAAVVTLAALATLSATPMAAASATALVQVPAAAAVAAPPAQAQAKPAGEAPVTSVYEVLDGQMRLGLRDLDGDGRKDLLTAGPAGLAWRRLREDGSFPAEDDGTLEWPSVTVGWNVADLEGDGRTEVVLLIDGERVATAAPGEGGALVLGPDRIADAGGFLPRGVRRVNFVRDIDGDGRLDLVIPANGRFLIHLQQERGWAPALPVDFQASVTLELGDPARLDASFSQRVKIPWFTLQDVDGDGRTDLVSETGQVAQFHLARPALPERPTWSLDLEALAASVPKPERIDLEDLLSNVEVPVNWKTADLDGEPPYDLVIQRSGTITVHEGGSVGPKLDQPDQVLKASGNVLYFLLRDVNKDRLPDLQLLRGGSFSIGELLRLLVVPGSLDFDVFSYINEGGRFARKPSVTTTLSLRIPALLGFLDDFREMRDDYRHRRDVPALPAALDGDGSLDDVVDVQPGGAAGEPGAVGVWKGAVPADFRMGGVSELKKFSPDELLEQYALSRLDALSDGGTLSIGIDDIRKLVMVTPGYDLRQAVAGRKPDARWKLAFPAEGATLRVEDIDADGRDDVIATGKDASGRQRVQFFLTR